MLNYVLSIYCTEYLSTRQIRGVSAHNIRCIYLFTHTNKFASSGVQNVRPGISLRKVDLLSTMGSTLNWVMVSRKIMSGFLFSNFKYLFSYPLLVLIFFRLHFLLHMCLITFFIYCTEYLSIRQIWDGISAHNIRCIYYTYFRIPTSVFLVVSRSIDLEYPLQV